MAWLRFALAVAALSAAPFGQPAFSAASSRTELLTLDQARAYMVELINQDRATKDLVPVALDSGATDAAQKHAEDMAAHRYMSHYNLEGKSPNQRYTEAGGTGYSRENVYLSSTRYVGSPVDADGATASLAANPRFSRTEIDEIESSYVNETPPTDGHRRNVLAPEHTGVGIGLARSASQGGRALANAQEFVDHYADVAPLPVSCAPGTDVTIAGKAVNGAKFRSISIGRAPVPSPLTREQATAIHSYSVPAAEATYWPAPYRSARQVRMSPDGTFSLTLRLGAERGPGLYYLAVWVEDHGRDLLASLRTVVVR